MRWLYAMAVCPENAMILLDCDYHMRWLSVMSVGLPVRWLFLDASARQDGCMRWQWALKEIDD